jgi:hypothetical protein
LHFNWSTGDFSYQYHSISFTDNGYHCVSAEDGKEFDRLFGTDQPTAREFLECAALALKSDPKNRIDAVEIIGEKLYYGWRDGDKDFFAGRNKYADLKHGETINEQAEEFPVIGGRPSDVIVQSNTDTIYKGRRAYPNDRPRLAARKELNDILRGAKARVK